jgi:hypothetical protein
MCSRVFLLSPARCSGKRAAILINPDATFELAVRLRAGRITLGEAFAFMSGLYFRGKLAYAEAFGGPDAALVIAPGRGLLRADTPITLEDLRAMAEVPVDLDEPRYCEPLTRDAARLADAAETVVLLGSIATRKYLDPLQAVLGERLVYPQAFNGIGDMSRGALMLRCVRAGIELDYVAAPPPKPKRRAARAPRSRKDLAA